MNAQFPAECECGYWLTGQGNVICENCGAELHKECSLVHECDVKETELE